MMNRYLSSAVVMAAMVAGLGLGATSCNEDGSNTISTALCSTTVYNPATGMRQDYGVTAIGKKVNAMLDATSSLVKAAAEIDTGMLAECTAMATELGIPAAQLEPPVPVMGADAGAAVDPGPAPRTRAACERVAKEIKSTLNANLKAQAYLSIVYEPAVCTVNVMARLLCVQTCETMTVTETELMCVPGKVYFPSCEGTCGGSCEGSCALECTGACSAECTGTCEVAINGKCNGTCSVALDAAGNCNGVCSSQVKGACAGTCKGGCTGTCKGGCTGSCKGGCRGSCTAGGVTPPVCEEVVTMRQEKTCETSCNAKASCEAMCTAPKLTVDIGAGIDAAGTAKVTMVANVVKAHYANILRLTEKAALVTGSTIVAYKTAISGLAGNVGEAGLQAGACIVNAGQAGLNAIAAVSVSASVSVNISASVSASGSAGGAAMAGM